MTYNGKDEPPADDRRFGYGKPKDNWTALIIVAIWAGVVAIVTLGLTFATTPSK